MEESDRELIERLRHRATEHRNFFGSAKDYELMEEAAARLEALSVGVGRTYSQAEVDAILKAAFPQVSGGGEDEGASCTESTDAPCSASSAAATDTQSPAGWLDGRQFSTSAGRRVRHVKRGTVYTLPFGQAEAMLQTAEPIDDDATLTIYIGEDGMIFARPTYEFYDGRFEALSGEDSAPAFGAATEGQGDLEGGA